MERYCVVTFEITSHAFIFEKEMKKVGLSIKLIPTPRELSSSCGMSAEIECDVKEEVKKICETNLIDGCEINILERKKKKGLFKK